MAGGEENGGLLFNGYRVPVVQDELWIWMMVMAVHYEWTSTMELYT